MFSSDLPADMWMFVPDIQRRWPWCRWAKQKRLPASWGLQTDIGMFYLSLLWRHLSLQEHDHNLPYLSKKRKTNVSIIVMRTPAHKGILWGNTHTQFYISCHFKLVVYYISEENIVVFCYKEISWWRENVVKSLFP